MKIADIKVGMEVGVLDRPSRSRYANQVLPRQAKVVEIKVNQITRRTGYGYGPPKVVNVKKILVKILDAKRGEGHYYDKLQNAVKGAVVTLDPKQLVAPWLDLEGNVSKSIARRQAVATAKTALEQRIDALLPKKGRGVYVQAHDGYAGEEISVSVTLRDDELRRIISLAEKGKAA